MARRVLHDKSLLIMNNWNVLEKLSKKYFRRRRSLRNSPLKAFSFLCKKNRMANRKRSFSNCQLQFSLKKLLRLTSRMKTFRQQTVNSFHLKKPLPLEKAYAFDKSETKSGQNNSCTDSFWSRLLTHSNYSQSQDSICFSLLPVLQAIFLSILIKFWPTHHSDIIL